jgi:predicted MFS family arabinose efflux permease
MDLGLVYFVFGPALVTTPLAGRVVARLGVRNAFRWSLAVAGLGLPLLLLPNLSAVIFGLACIGMGTFFAQAATTGFVGRAATSDPSAASGMYLASYFFGGLVSAALIGQLFQRFGWSSAIAAIGLALGLAAVLAQGMVPISDSVVAKPRMANA